MTIRRQYLASLGLDEHAEAGEVQREPWACQYRSNFPQKCRLNFPHFVK